MDMSTMIKTQDASAMSGDSDIRNGVPTAQCR